MTTTTTAICFAQKLASRDRRARGRGRIFFFFSSLALSLFILDVASFNVLVPYSRSCAR